MKDQTSKVSVNRLKKEQIVSKLLQKAEKSKAMVFTNYQGLTHQQIENLKKTLKATDAELVVAKNTLLRRVLTEKKYTVEDSALQNQTAALFLYDDIIAPLKQLAKTIKELSLPSIKFGILDGKILTDQEVLKLSTLAPLPVLRAQLLGTMMGPVSGLHRALNWNIQKLVMTLSAIQSQKA